MPERSTIAQKVQLGVETTPGTAVAASKGLLATSLDLNVGSDVHTFRPRGSKYATIVYNGREWTEVGLSGDATYSELQYVLSSLLTTPVVTQIMDSATPTGAYRWTFSPASFGADNPKTYTVESGDATRAHRAANLLIGGCTIGWNRTEVTLDGDGLAAAIEDGITLTAAPATIDTVPVIPTQISVYLDDAAANLGDTKLLRNLGGEFEVSDRYGTLFVVDRDNPSFVATLETEPSAQFTLMLEANAQGMAYLENFRTGSSVFLRVEAIGPRIYEGATTPADVHYSLTIDVAGKVGEVNDLNDQDGVYAIEFPFTVVHDSTWGKAMSVELVNKQATL